MAVLHAPPNDILRIDHVWLFISSDETGEGVIAAPLMGAGSMVPLIAADENRLEALRSVALDLAKIYGRRIKLVKFSLREEIEEIAA